MGSCNSREKVVIVNNHTRQSTSQNIKKFATKESESKENMDPNFKDMIEWEGERYKGEGIKRMKGYRCDMQIDRLNSLREEFWNSKSKDKLIWKHIKQACIMDDGKLILIYSKKCHLFETIEFRTS